MYPISANAKQRFLEGGKQIARLTVINDEYEPYKGEVYNVPFTYEGQNIFTRENETENSYINASGNISTSQNYCVSDYIEVEECKRYVFDASMVNLTSGVFHAFYDDEKTRIAFTSATQEGFISPTGAKYVRLSYRKDAGASDFHISIGTVPHGTLDVKTGVLTVDYAYISDLSIYFFSRSSATFPYIFVSTPMSNIKVPTESSGRLEGIASSGYKISTSYSVNASMTRYSMLRSNARLYFRNDDYNDDAVSFRASLSGQQAIYELASPCTYQLTAQEVRTLLGYNNIWSDTGTVNLSYRNTSGEVVAKSGDMVSIDDGAKNIPLASLSLPLLPKQDLHGYDYPWVGGGGKNKADITVNTDAQYMTVTKYEADDIEVTNNYTTSKFGACFLFNAVSGTSYTFTVSQYTVDGVNLGANVYLYSNYLWGTKIVNFSIPSNSHTYTWESTYTGLIMVGIYVGSGKSVVCKDFMVRLSTETSDDWTPYENICPITGYTEANVTRTGKNLFDLNDLTAENITIADGVASGTARNFYYAFGQNTGGIPNLIFPEGTITLSFDGYTDGEQGQTNNNGLFFRFGYDDGTYSPIIGLKNIDTTWTHVSGTVVNGTKAVVCLILTFGNQPNNTWHIKNIQLQSEAQTEANLVITEDKIIEGGLSVNRYCTTGKAVMVGSVVAGEMNAVLNNEDGAFNDVNFIGHDIKVEVGTMDGDTPDYIPLGYFQVDDSPKKLAHISLTTLDRMMLLEKDIDESKLEFPMTVNNLFSIICNECGVTPASGQTLLNGTYEIEAYPENVQTYRDLLSCIAEISGTCAYFDWNGELRLEWFNPTPAVELNTHNRTSSDLSEESVIITGVEVKASDGDYLAGDDGFLLTVAQNPLITHDYQSVADSLYNARGNFGYRPFTANTLPMPYLYPLDTATFVDKNGNESVVAITDWTFRLNRNTDLRGRGESTLQASFKKKYGLTEGGVSIDEAIGLLRDTIIKNAEIVNQSMEELSRTLHGEYEAISSEFGTYRNETDAKITANADGITQAYSNIEEIDSKYGVAVNDTNQAVLTLGDGAVATNTKFRELTEAYIKSGKLYYEGATPVYGVAVGQLTYETVGGEELVKRSGVYSVFTSEELAFYIDDVKVAYMRNKKLYINEAEFVAKVKIGNFTLDGTNGFTIK